MTDALKQLIVAQHPLGKAILERQAIALVLTEDLAGTALNDATRNLIARLIAKCEQVESLAVGGVR